jgi:hypothetical protein
VKPFAAVKPPELPGPRNGLTTILCSVGKRCLIASFPAQPTEGPMARTIAVSGLVGWAGIGIWLRRGQPQLGSGSRDAGALVLRGDLYCPGSSWQGSFVTALFQTRS